MKLKENLTGLTPCYDTDFDIYVTDKFVKVHFSAYHSSLTSAGKKFNDDLYKGDVVEVFLDMGVRDHYFEIEVAPNGNVFLADIHNYGRFTTTKLEHNFIERTVKIVDNNYFVDMEIPLKDLGYQKEKGIKFNAFRIETDGEIQDKHIFAYNPTFCESFHRPWFFKKLI